MGPGCSRRQVLALAAGAGLALVRRPPAPTPTSSGGGFLVHHDGHDVRCLYQASAPTTVPPLVVVLIHGAGADASQWIDIGLGAVVAAVAADHPTPLVAIAPDVTPGNVAALVLDAVVPAAEAHFSPHGAFAISGISRGGGQALQVVLAAPRRFSSLGLHSPALPASFDPRAVSTPVYIDAGDRDALARSARRLADELRSAGIPVWARWPPGGHDRPYWRAHLREYLDFHLQTHETTT